MTVFKNFKGLFAFLLSLSSLSTFAQDSTPPPTDSTAIAIDSPAEAAPAEVKFKPYERFKLNVDTVTNLVTYKAIIDQSETGPDSFYVRAKKWADKKYNLVKNKKIILLDKPNEKMVLRTKFDAYTSSNKNNKVVVGTINFTLTIIFKEDKYKYIIDNISYEPFQDPEALKDKKLKPENYEDVAAFEYLLVKKFKVKETDNLLKSSDKEINLLIAEIKKSLKNPLQVDEDDF